MNVHGTAISDVETMQGGRFIIEDSSLVDEFHRPILRKLLTEMGPGGIIERRKIAKNDRKVGLLHGSERILLNF